MQILPLIVLHHSHMKLARQADDGAHGQHRIDGQLQQIAGRDRHHGIQEIAGDPGVLRARLTQDEPEGEAPHRDKGQQFDHGFEGDGHHHAPVMLGGIQMAGAEQYAEQGQ